MKPTYHHYSALAIAFAVFLASIGGYIFIYYSVNDQSAATAKAESDVTTEQGAAVRQQNIVDSLAATADDRALVNSFLLSPDGTVAFIEKVEGISQGSGAAVSLASISADSASVYAHVNIQGQWSNMMRAMHLVENLPYSIGMDNVRVSLQGKGAWSEDFDITIPLTNASTGQPAIPPTSS
jgi:uncharacterized iron-regulated membrane protein